VAASSVVSGRLSNQLASKQASSKQAIARTTTSSSREQQQQSCLLAMAKLAFACWGKASFGWKLAVSLR